MLKWLKLPFDFAQGQDGLYKLFMPSGDEASSFVLRI